MHGSLKSGPDLKADSVSTGTWVYQREATACMRVQEPPDRELSLRNKRITHVT